MATNHIPRLLRLARRTGDRLIVTDEAGGGEPMVILPLEEYEVLIDQAFGPGGGSEEQKIEPFGRNQKEMIEISDEEGLRAPIELEVLHQAHSMRVADDEADIDEESLKDLWQEPGEVKIDETLKEVVKNTASRDEKGEEQFYLEAID